MRQRFVVFSNSILLIFCFMTFCHVHAQDTLDIINHEQYKELERKLSIANETYNAAKETYESAKEYMNRSESKIDQFYTRFYSLIGIILAIVAILGGVNVVNIRRNIRKLEEDLIKKQTEEIGTIMNENEDMIKRMIRTGKEEYLILEDSSLLVIKYNDYKLSEAEEKVISLFRNRRNLTIQEKGLNQSDIYESLKKDRKTDAVVLFGWDPNEPHQLTTMIDIAKSICPEKAMMYVGNHRFPSVKAGKSKEFMISFANAPSQIYGNLINLLKFKNALAQNA